MENGDNNRRIDQPVQALPIPAHDSDEIVEGGNCQGNEQEYCQHPGQQVDLASDQAPDLGEVEGIIEPKEDQQVQASVEEGVKADRAAAVWQIAQTGQCVERRDRQGGDHPIYGNPPKDLFKVLDRIDGQFVGVESEDQINQWQPAKKVD